ncbi:MAG TPA: hypothetical protein VEH84_08850 [Alphaproteobacteria bacterium]|nr:hypothetical protein [Alphaproteobacteria bacterium]
MQIRPYAQAQSLAAPAGRPAADRQDAPQARRGDPVDTIALSPAAAAWQRLQAQAASLPPDLRGTLQSVTAGGPSGDQIGRLGAGADRLAKAGDAIREALGRYAHVLEAFGLKADALTGFKLTKSGDFAVSSPGPDGKSVQTTVIPAKLLGRDAKALRTMFEGYGRERAAFEAALQDMMDELRKREEEAAAASDALAQAALGGKGGEKDDRKGADAPPVPSDLVSF